MKLLAQDLRRDSRIPQEGVRIDHALSCADESSSVVAAIFAQSTRGFIRRMFSIVRRTIAIVCAQLTSKRVPPMLSNTSKRLGITEEAIMTVTVTSKGQVTVPKPVRDRLGIKPGSKVDFEVAEDGRAFLRKVGKRTVKPSRFERMRGTATSGLTTDAIMALSRGESR
jgi:antitoxin PrlF